MTIYMEVTQDKYELPLALADSPGELAKIVKCTANNVSSCVSKRKSGIYKSGRFIAVKVKDEQEE